MEYMVLTVLIMMATIMVAIGDERDGPYETNYLGSSDPSYNSLGSQQGYKREQGGHGQDYYAEPHYAFAYEVHDDHTGDIKAHKEERKGDHTQGMYMLVEPNGSKRIVEYVVQGKSGFNAKVHQSKPQEPHGGHIGSTGYTGGHTGQSGYTRGHAGQSGYAGGHAGNSYTSRGHSGQSGYTGGHASQNGYAGEHAGHSYTGGQSGQSDYTRGHAGKSGYAGGHADHRHTGGHSGQNSYTGGSHTNGLGDYATGYYTSHNQSPYKVQENNPNYNDKPLSYKPRFNLQPFKPLIPYVPADPQPSKNPFPYSTPITALYRPQTSYKPLSLNKPVSYKFIPAHKESSHNILHPQGNHGHATSSVSFSSHGSKIASTTNHLVHQQKRYENKH